MYNHSPYGTPISPEIGFGNSESRMRVSVALCSPFALMAAKSGLMVPARYLRFLNCPE